MLGELINDRSNKDAGYPKMCEKALSALLKDGGEYPQMSPNNILALEYIKAIKTTKSSIKPHTVARVGAGYDAKKIEQKPHQSATAIRTALASGDISALEYVPNLVKDIVLDAVSQGDAPCSESALSAAVISHFRLNSPTDIENIHDVGGGLYNRLKDLSFKANSIESLICSAESKNFTKARIRRTLFYSLLGVTSSQFKDLPAYTQLLAFDLRGRAMLRTIGKQSHFPILTKPSDTSKLPCQAISQKMISDKADSIFQMAKPVPKDGNSALRFTPYVKN
jgi:predicted nucleotidyltransferase